MAKYTISLYELAQEKSDSTNLNQQIEDLRRYLFSFNYSMYQESHKTIFEKKFIRHYLMWEIGLETPQLFKVFLENRLYELMPYYNQLYKLQNLFDSINLFEDRNMYTKNTTDEDETQKDKVDTNEDSETRENENNQINIDIDDIEQGQREVNEDEEHQNTNEGNEKIEHTQEENKKNSDNEENEKNENEINENKEQTTESGTKNNTGKEYTSNDKDIETNEKIAEYDNSTLTDTGDIKTIAHNTIQHDIDETNNEQNNKGISDYPQGNVAANKDYYSTGEIYKGKDKKIGDNLDTEDIDQTVTNNLTKTDISDKDNRRKLDTTETNTTDIQNKNTETLDSEKNNSINGNKDISINEIRKYNSNEDTNIQSNDDKTYESNENGTLDKNLKEKYNNTKNNTEVNKSTKENDIEYNKLMKQARDLIRNLQRYDNGHEHGLTGSRTITEMITEYKENYFDVDILLINELNDLFMNIY